MKLPIICLVCICNALTISQFKNERLPTIRRVAYDDKKYDKDIKSFMIDIDGTICKTKDSNYHESFNVSSNWHLCHVKGREAVLG